MGYARAGYEVVGVDIKPQPHYPFEFHLADALTYPLDGFDLIHASPPCQLFSRAQHLRDAQGGTASTINLIPETRERLTGHPYVIENVPGAPLRADVILCGSAFGLRVRRHRIFETSHDLPARSGPCRHKEQGRPVGVYHVMADHVPQGGTTARDLPEAQEAMGIDWMTWNELKLAIPPAYTAWIGSQFLVALGS